MSLRNRFRLLLGIFGVSVVANVLVSVWCIHIYVGEAIGRFELLTFSLWHTDRVRRLIDDLVTDLRQRPERHVRDARYRTLNREIGRAIDELPFSVGQPQDRAQLGRLRALTAELSSASEAYVELLDAGSLPEARALLETRIIADRVQPIHRVLANIGLESDAMLRRTAAAIGDEEARITTILTLNAVAAFLLAAVGVHLVRNWVLRPVRALTEAAEHHASGDLSYRIHEIPRHELGVLSREVNRMADSLLEIQNRLLEQERMAAIGEVTSTVAHNIRNPLAGIRASAQSCLADLPESGDLPERQADIVRTVDSLNRWLRELLQVTQPIELECRSTPLRELVGRVTAVLESEAQRRGIRFVIDESPPGCVARVDPPRIEQAVLTVVINALDASPADAEVRVQIRRQAGSDWALLEVVDSGPGVPPDVLERIASPYFSTKPGGIGIGLYLTRRVVQAHGGALGFRNNPDRGTTVTLRLPGAANVD